MLTAALRVYHWDRRTSSISSDRLEAASLPHLERVLAVYRRSVGQPRGRVRDAARAALAGLRPDRVEPVVKLCDDVSTYAWARGRLQAARRLRVFEAAARRHPVDADAARSLLADEFSPPPAGLDQAVAALYADYPEFHVLRRFPRPYDALDLRADYDLAQAQALLYSATRVTVEARADFKHVLQYARLARLLHRIERVGRGHHRFVLDGPSSILRRTRAYGVDFARFLAGLVQARGWRLDAEILLRREGPPLHFTLRAEDGLRSRVPPPALFDSALEEAFAERFGPERAGWRLDRESVVLRAGREVLVPDFVFTHGDGTEVALEIVGYWTPEYLEDKLRKLRAIQGIHLLAAVPRRLGLGPAEVPGQVLTFGSRLRPADVLARLEAFRQADGSPGEATPAVSSPRPRRDRGRERSGWPRPGTGS